MRLEKNFSMECILSKLSIEMYNARFSGTDLTGHHFMCL